MLFLKTIPQGAATQCYVATHPDLADVTGAYFSHSNESKTTKHGQDDDMAEKLWETTEKIVAGL